MTRLTHRMWRKDEQVKVTSSSFAYLRPDCGQIQANASPSLVELGPPGT